MEMEEEARKNEAATSFTSLPDASMPMSVVEEYAQWMKEEIERSERRMKENLKQIEELDRKREERNRRREADHKDYMERMAREIDEIKYGPPVSYPIITCSIPSVPVQEVSTLQVFPSFPIIETTIASAPIQKVSSLQVAPKKDSIEGSPQDTEV